MKSNRVPTPAPALQDVLYEFTRAKEVPDAALLNEFLARYPQHADALRELAVQNALEAASETLSSKRSAPTWPPAHHTSPSVSKALQSFDERLELKRKEKRALTQAHSHAPEVADPFARLSRAELREVGRRLNANTLFVTQLRDRLIEAQTISEGFLQLAARLLQTTSTAMGAYLAGPPQLAAGMSFKSEQKPEVGKKQSFADAVGGSDLTAEQQKHLLAL